MSSELSFIKRTLTPLMHSTGAVQYSQTLDWTLVSGKKSNAYCDARLATCNSKARNLIGEGLIDLCPMRFQIAGGMEVGAVPVADALGDAFERTGLEFRNVWVRKQPKGHGTGEWIAALRKNERLDGLPTVVVEDTFTSGASTLEAVKRLREVGADVKAVLGVVDREAGARQLFESEGLYFATIFTFRELLPEGFVVRVE